MPVKIKTYRTLEDMQRDFKIVLQDVREIEKELEGLKLIYEVASAVIASKISVVTAAPGGVRRVRDTKLAPVPKKALKNDQVAKHFDQLKRLRENADTLQSMISALTLDFAGPARDRMLKEATKLYRDVQDRMSTAESLLSKLAEQHLPPELKKLTQAVANMLNKRLGGKFESLKIGKIVAPVERTMHFCSYIILRGLTDESGLHDVYTIVLTQVLDGDRPSLHANTFIGRVPLPGFRLGQEITDANSAVKYITTRMGADKFMEVLEPRKLPEGAEITLSPQEVQSVKVEDNRIKILFKSTVKPEAIERLWAETILLELRHIFGRRLSSTGRKDITRWNFQRTLTKVGKAHQLTVVLAPRDRYDLTLDAKQLEAIQKLMNLTNDQVEVIRDALESM